MSYVVSFRCVKRLMRFDGEIVSIQYESFLEWMLLLGLAIPVDEDWYCRTYIDITRETLAKTVFQTPSRHYALAGYIDGRVAHDPAAGPLPVPFRELQTQLSIRPVRGGFLVQMPRLELQAAVSGVVRAIPVDEAWYERQYPDIADAVAAGTLSRARDHFTAVGYFEGRMPGHIEVDEAWYLASYPDLAAAKQADGNFSGVQHFHHFGYYEGRLPSPDVPVI